MKHTAQDQSAAQQLQRPGDLPEEKRRPLLYNGGCCKTVPLDESEDWK